MDVLSLGVSSKKDDQSSAGKGSEHSRQQPMVTDPPDKAVQTQFEKHVGNNVE
jgi:hypothetical protein